VAKNKFVQTAPRKEKSTILTTRTPEGALLMFDYMKPPEAMSYPELVAATRHLLDVAEQKKRASKFVQFGR
jgi:hypothetical protein